MAQLDELPDYNGVRYELHHGEMDTPRLQLRLLRLLDLKVLLRGHNRVQLSPLAEFEYRIADVVAVSLERWDAMDPYGALAGAPELVVEVKSPSNTKPKLRELAPLCLANGSLEFWIVDQVNQSVTVTRRNGVTVAYLPGESMPLDVFGGGSLPVAEIFTA